MLQAVMIAPGKIEFREIPRPRPAENDVLIEMKRIGVCGSDIHVFHGLHPYTSYPVVQGHEVAGVVAEVGGAVAGLAPGDVVTLMPQVTCGTCYPCRHGMYHICDSLKVMGFQTDGAAQEYIAVDSSKVLRLPASVRLGPAAMIEPVSVAVHALARGGGARGKRVLVLGAGTIGNLVGQVARATGARAVVITDINDTRLAKAAECGLDVCVNSSRQDLGEAVLEAFGPERADLILECVGIEQTIGEAVSLARKGTTIVGVGVFGKKPAVDLGLVQDRELNLVGTLMYQKVDYEKAIELAAAGKLSLEVLITHRFAFMDYLEAYQTIDSAAGNAMKVMIELG